MKTKYAQLYAIRYWLFAIFAGSLLAVAAGCDSADRPDPLKEQINSLKQEKTQLTRQIKQSGLENEKLKKQIQVLSGLPADAKLENFYNLQRVKISGYTDFYDKDKDGRKEKLIVYIQPIDQDGDVVKATGSVEVQLWNLNRPNGQALLGQWRVEPDELRKLWFATLITINYRLTFDVADKIEKLEEPLTVKLTFTDHLSGKVFKEQKVIEPQ